MGEMWPRIYNLAEKSGSARGQLWAPGVSSSSGSLVPRWAESHLSMFARERLVFIPQKTRGSVSPPTLEAPGAVTLISSPLSPAPICPLCSPLEALTQQPLPGSSTRMAGRNKVKTAPHLMESAEEGKRRHDGKIDTGHLLCARL